MHATRDDIYAWADRLSFQEARDALTDLVERMIEIEEVQFSEHHIAPLWNASGDPLVDGQQTNREE